MAHTNPHSRFAPTSRLFEVMAWSGLGMATVSMGGLALFSIYHLLSGVLPGGDPVVTSSIWLLGVVALAVGAGCSIVGFTVGFDPRPRQPAEPEIETRTTIAA